MFCSEYVFRYVTLLMTKSQCVHLAFYLQREMTRMIHISNELSLFYDNYTAKSPFTLLSTSAVLLGLCVLFHIKSDVCFFLSGYRYLGDCDTDRREILNDGTHQSQNDLLRFWGRYPQGIPNFGPKFGQINRQNISKTVRRSDTCQLELNISSTETF